LRSTTIGTPGVKYGSPTSSLPRRASSTTVGSTAVGISLRKPVLSFSRI
jgi:hypothetical protein